jgi:hypothetical protein
MAAVIGGSGPLNQEINVVGFPALPGTNCEGICRRNVLASVDRLNQYRLAKRVRMVHKEHKPFNETVFKALCQRASEDLPETVKDAQFDWETRHVAALEHLLAIVQDFCGIAEGFKFQDLSGFPRSIQLKQEIIGIVDFDSVHEHPTSVFFLKQPIIEEYVRETIGDESE